MKTAATLLTADMHYDVPPQDLAVDLSRIPALPYDFTISNVRRRVSVAGYD
jgi:fatty-acid peroxygenase